MTPGSILIHPDLTKNIVGKLPGGVSDLMQARGAGICVAGGFCRDAFIGEDPKDVDIFATSIEELGEAVLWFEKNAKEYQRSKATVNSVNFVANFDDEQAGFKEVIPVQFVDRVFYLAHGELIRSFDWSVCQIAVYWNPTTHEWLGICTEKFGEDIQSGTLHYMAPERDEDPGASVLRMMRFTQRGWKPTEDSIARCLGRFTNEIVDPGGLNPFVPDYSETIKKCFRNVGYSGKGKKSESFPLGD